MGPIRWMLAAAVALIAGAAFAEPPQFTPTGQFITPSAAPGAIFAPLNPHLAGDPSYTAGQASAVALSPDARTLLVLTSGYNLYFDKAGARVPEISEEYVFVFDVSGGKPVQRQVIRVPNTFLGLAWDPSGARFFVSGGVDDCVYEYLRQADGFDLGRTFKLGHAAGVGLAVRPEAGALAVSPDGRQLLVANVQNESVTLIDLGSGALTEQDLRPGVIDPAKAGAPGGSFPRAVIWTSPARAYVASERDREVIALDVADHKLAVAGRTPVHGQPVAFAARGTRLYAALDNADRVAVLDARSGRLLGGFSAAIGAGAPPALARGWAAPAPTAWRCRATGARSTPPTAARTTWR